MNPFEKKIVPSDMERHKKLVKKLFDYLSKKGYKKYKESFNAVAIQLGLDYTQLKRVINGAKPANLRRKRIGSRKLSDQELDRLQAFLDDRLGYVSAFKLFKLKVPEIKHYTTKAKDGKLIYLRIYKDTLEVFLSKNPTDNPIEAIEGELVEKISGLNLHIRNISINKKRILLLSTKLPSLLQKC